ncbi:MAG: PilZ domain-containing protein [Anaerolineae bacterium]|jgi:hypothetical protein|nr:PilZ domain-containing protein [Anaerolineae bacterium]MBT7192075.1 PilZ domain-containing protein [Anaerolineae bacterium]MBT7990151.1 PilZ domain-containing protein [Anaerolineae bacterium]
MDDKRVEKRKDFSYYMQLTDAATRTLVGHLADISTGGFKLDSDAPIPTEKEYRFHLALTPDVASKPFMIFRAQSKWCQADPIDPFVYNTGFHLIEMHPEDREIFNRVLELYGTKKRKGGTTPLNRGHW